MTCLGFDYGLKRIGVAVGERLLGDARPLATLANDCGTPDWGSIDALLAEWLPDTVVVGLPLTVEGGEQEITRQTRGFIRRLGKRPALPEGAVIETSDERFSSIEAAERLRAARADGRRTRRVRHEDVDSAAAAIILERWFDRTRANASAGADAP